MRKKQRQVTLGILNITAATATATITGLLIVNAVNNLRKN